MTRSVRSVLARTLTLAAAAIALHTTSARAQQPATPAPDNGPKVGDMAPDFTLPGATKAGVTAQPIKLSSLKGQTVVIAFFPRVRTSGCTAQMNSYRDQYATLFNGGKGVTVLAISTDSASQQASWATEANFPVTFVSDVAGSLGAPYDVMVERNGQKFMRRVLFVVGPDGRIKHVMRPFRELAADSYTELQAAVEKASAGK
jgi:peroxiredoxin Q/BCP